jgi:predicted phage replisome organizer
MANDVKWIKIVTDIFDDEKVLLIESLPEADSIIVIWFKLLCLGGKNNNSGVFTMNNKIPYTEEMLATIFRRKVTIVKMALEVFEKFGMVEIVNDTITLPNWSQPRSRDQLEKRKEYMREYMQKHREKQKQLTTKDDGKQCKVNSKTNSKVNVSTLEVDIDRDIEEDNISSDKTLSFGTYKRVKLTNSQYESLIKDYSKSVIDNQIALLDEYVEITNNKQKYKNFNLLLRKTLREKWFDKKQYGNKKVVENPNWYDDYEQGLKATQKQTFTEEELIEAEKKAKELFK